MKLSYLVSSNSSFVIIAALNVKVNRGNARNPYADRYEVIKQLYIKIFVTQKNCGHMRISIIYKFWRLAPPNFFSF